MLPNEKSSPQRKNILLTYEKGRCGGNKMLVCGYDLICSTLSKRNLIEEKLILLVLGFRIKEMLLS